MDNEVEIKKEVGDDYATLTMEITPEMEKQFKGEPFFLEIEMLQGDREELENGMIKYKCVINDHDKAELMKEFVLKCISHSWAPVKRN